MVAIIVDYHTETRVSDVDMYANSDLVTYTLDSDLEDFLHEQHNSLLVIGQNYDYTASNAAESQFFNGYIYDIKIYNDVRTDTQIRSQLDDNCAAYDQTTCVVCPSASSRNSSSASQCISDCYVGEYTENGSVCLTCDADCQGNCVRSGDLNCGLCDYELTLTCETFERYTDLTCKNNASIVITTNGDECACDSNQQLIEPEFECGCTEECEACTQLDRYHCSICKSGWHKQIGADFCFDYCAVGYAVDPNDSTVCTGSDITVKVDTWEIKAIPRASDTDPIPAIQRGWYFDGSHRYQMEEVMHHTGSIDSFFRTTDIIIINTLYSRHSTDDDFIDLYINRSGSVVFTVVGSSGADQTLSTAVSSIAVESWHYVSVTWDWTGTHTDFSLQVDNDAVDTYSGNDDVVIEDSESNTAYLGIAFDLNSSGV